VAGKKQGYAVEIAANGYKYEGEWWDDLRHGQGKLTSPNGDVYEGAMFNSTRHGFGVEVQTLAGVRYEGQWRHGRRHGRGKLTFPDGRVEEGPFQEGRYVGPKSRV
jgi:hypothetical protein